MNMFRDAKSPTVGVAANVDLIEDHIGDLLSKREQIDRELEGIYDTLSGFLRQVREAIYQNRRTEVDMLPRGDDDHIAKALNRKDDER